MAPPRCSSNTLACAAWTICPPQTSCAVSSSRSRRRWSRPTPAWRPCRRSNCPARRTTQSRKPNPRKPKTPPPQPSRNPKAKQAEAVSQTLLAMNIPDHRKAIDKLDTQLIKLSNERTRHVLAIGVIKRKAGEEIYAPHRERAVLQRICRKNQGPITNPSLRAIYREIMSSALSLEKTLTVAYLGPEATFTHQAAIQRFGSSLRYAPQKTIADVFSEVSKNRADYGVVPVENSTEGVVTHTLDMFVDSDLKVVSQIVLPVQQCLLSNSPRAQIKKLFTHPQSLAQCRGWVQTICRAPRS